VDPDCIVHPAYLVSPSTVVILIILTTASDDPALWNLTTHRLLLDHFSNPSHTVVIETRVCEN
jgi:hypothetical protein